ncbi:CBS domain-containing protein [Colwellia sp. E2M01]|uniref:CBS domain-containing protein n=1 Tax=Colwellia sp. E2M01 TaxID=2841561 RepID=UPI001C0911B9|nr:CBS domain-containing protein [Colwellia sp. E2M01]MBU2871699.1 CBS domain-containing protein [Colwellia sp. E2M01]
MQTITAQTIMDSSPLSFLPNIGVIVALRQLLDSGLSGAPVVDANNNLVGFLSEADCMRGALMGGYFSSIGELVQDRMSTEVEAISTNTNLVDIANKFLCNNRRVLPVVTDGKVVGLIERRFVLEKLVEQIDNNNEPVTYKRNSA